MSQSLGFCFCEFWVSTHIPHWWLFWIFMFAKTRYVEASLPQLSLNEWMPCMHKDTKEQQSQSPKCWMNVDYEILWTHDATFWSALHLPVTFNYIVTWNPTEFHVNILLAPHARLCQQTVEEAYCLQFWRFGRLRTPSFLVRGNIQAITTVCTIL